VTRVTNHEDFPVMAASAGGGRIIYEQAGWLFVIDPGSRTSRRLAVGVTADLRERRPRWIKGTDAIQSAAAAPGSTAAGPT
jgi:tricorn protease